MTLGFNHEFDEDPWIAINRRGRTFCASAAKMSIQLNALLITFPDSAALQTGYFDRFRFTVGLSFDLSVSAWPT